MTFMNEIFILYDANILNLDVYGYAYSGIFLSEGRQAVGSFNLVKFIIFIFTKNDVLWRVLETMK